ncbi:unnamed protein product [Mytilus coruscus]|uniref:Uncharacterized protein n=1 Tax=Mytilus coruscus TaxID=42192 RepID=A0A6J8A743_MYTCO|nr:unnamed protein product [Mytilus coruscus]
MIVLAMQIFAGAIEMYKWLNTEQHIEESAAVVIETKAENHETSNSTEEQNLPSTSTTDTVVKSNKKNANKATPKTNQKPVAVVNDIKAKNHETTAENHDTKAENNNTKAENHDTKAENNDTKAENHDTSNSTEKQNLPSTSTTDKVVKSNTEKANKAAPKTNQSNGFGGMKKGFLL